MNISMKGFNQKSTTKRLPKNGTRKYIAGTGQ
jgi:hypothetical protein